MVMLKPRDIITKQRMRATMSDNLDGAITDIIETGIFVVDMPRGMAQWRWLLSPFSSVAHSRATCRLPQVRVS
jgi:hypothetical protein